MAPDTMVRFSLALESEVESDEARSTTVGDQTWSGVWWGLCVGITLLSLGLFMVALPLRYAELSRVAVEQPAAHLQLAPADAKLLADYGATLPLYGLLILSLETGLVLAFAAISCIILWRKPNERMALFFAVTSITYGVFITPPLDSLLAEALPLSLASRTVQALGLWCALVFFYLFPNGRLTHRWTRVMVVAAGIWCLSWIVYPVPLLDPVNPFVMTLPGLTLHLGWFVSGLIAQVQRYYATTGPVQRQQTRWVIVSVSAAVVSYALIYAPPLLWPGLPLPGWFGLFNHLVIQPTYLMLLYILPLSIFISIWWYGLWDVDLLLNRALVYGVLTALLAVIYFMSVVSLPALFPALTGVTSPVTISISTLLTAALVAPLRRRVQASIDYRFFRRQYDAARILAAFGAVVRDEIDMERLIDQLKAAIEETLAPVWIGCWIRHGQGYEECALGDRLAAEPIPADDPLAPLLLRLGDVADVADLAAGSLDQLAMHRGRLRLVAPMISHGELLGWLSLGPRRSGAGYNAGDRRLLNMLLAQVAPALRVAQLIQEQQEAAVARERIAQELRLARTVQQTLLPQTLPTLDGWALAARFEPAHEVSGDFFDLLLLDERHLALVIGDVVGKGVPAALLMASARSLIRTIARQKKAPGIVLHEVNEVLNQDMPPGMFVTCLYGVLDLETGKFRFANSGHNLPYRRGAGGAQTLYARGMPLGMMPGQPYDETEAYLAPGEALLLYSDGIIETHNDTRAMYGSQRLARVIGDYAGPGVGLAKAVLEDVRCYTGAGHEQEDDITVMVVARAEQIAASEQTPAPAIRSLIAGG
jgi:serine phosphatase RsbU (regulator of sigma subunit)